MPNFGLLATETDLLLLLDLLVQETGCRLYDSYGPDGQPVRTYPSAESLASALLPGGVPGGADEQGTHLHLRLWMPGMRGTPVISRHHRVHRRVPTFRECCEGWGLLVLVGEGLRTNVSWNGEARARSIEATWAARLGPVDAWDWRGVDASAAALQYHARALAVDRLGTAPVLPGAAEALATRPVAG